ncbi:MAG: carboxypeptidase-like regulatory domain-containing protein, partial [Bacteroidia bacterium]
MRWLLILFALIPLLASGQENFTLSGKVTDAETGEDLIGVTVVVVELVTGAATNSYGFYSISIPAGKYTIRYSYLGYESVDRVIDFNINHS